MLSHWAETHDVEVDIRFILASRGADCSPEACKTWAQEFIRRLAPRWPQTPLTTEQAVMIGGRFGETLAAARLGKAV